MASAKASHGAVLGAAVGGAAVAGMLVTRLSLVATGVLVAVAAAALVALFVVHRFGTRGLSAVALAAAAATLGMNSVRLSASVALSDFFLFTAGLILLPGLLLHAKQRLAAVKWLTGGTLLIVLGGLAGTAVSGDPALSLAQLTRFSIASVLLPILFALWNPSVDEIRRIAWLWVASVTASAVVAVGESGTFYHDGRADGLTTHPNHLALTCALAIGPAVVLTLLSRGLARWLGLAACALLVGGLLISGSRAGLIAFVLVLIAMAVLTRRMAIAGGIVAATIAAAVLIFSGLVDLPAGNAVSRLIGSDDRTVTRGVLGSDAARREELRLGLERIMEHPITGTGFAEALAAHDIYLQVWAAAGIFGLAGFAIIIVALLNLPIRAFLARSPFVDPPSMLLIGFSASFIGYLVAGVFHNALWDRYIWLTPALLAVITPHAIRSLAGARNHDHRPLVAAPRAGRSPQPAPFGGRENVRA
ncbi:MAG: O-antigen ligase family protein [Thermomicrobiales bacterium]